MIGDKVSDESASSNSDNFNDNYVSSSISLYANDKKEL